jgi:hypothetical protein
MATCTQRKTVVFSRPFRIKGVARVSPPGDYQVVTDEELIERLSLPIYHLPLPVYHRVSAAIVAPAQSHQASSIEMVAIDLRDLQSARDRDMAAQKAPAAETKPATGRSQDFE